MKKLMFALFAVVLFAQVAFPQDGRASDPPLPRLSIQAEAGFNVSGFIGFPPELALTPGSYSGSCCDPNGNNRSQPTPIRIGFTIPLGAGLTIRPFGGGLRNLGLGAKIYRSMGSDFRMGLTSNKPLTYLYTGEQEYTYTAVVEMKLVPQFELTYGIRQGDDHTDVIEVGALVYRREYLIEQGWDSFNRPNRFRSFGASAWMYGGLVRYKVSVGSKSFATFGADASYGRYTFDLPAGSYGRYQWQHSTWSPSGWAANFLLGFEWGPF
jgi:hypothetical protein